MIAPARLAALSSLVLALGCGWRTELDITGADERGDAGTAPSDAALADAGARDSGPAPGTACAADRECGGATACVADVLEIGDDLAPVPLLCAPRTAAAPDGSFCDEAFECDRGLCSVAGRCVRPCIDASDCDAGAACVEVFVRTAALALQPLDACAERVDAPDDVEVETLPYEGGLVGRGFDEVWLPAARRVTTWVLVPRDPVSAYVDRLRTADSARTILFDVDLVSPGADAPLNPVAFGVTPFTILLPNGPRSVLSEAGYEVRLVADGPSDLVATRLTRDGRRTVLDLDLFYVGARDLGPSGDRGPRRVSDALEDVEALLGIRIGDVRQHEIVGEKRSRLAMIESTPDGELPELGELFRLSATAGRASVSIFFVRFLGEALGVAGGIPGPPAMHGTPGSGIAIAADVIEDLGAGVELGHALAHELGHYLGLFHASEHMGLVLDPLPDTEECRLDRDADADGILRPDECAGRGGDLLMFWAATGDRITDDQRDVIFRAPVLH